MIASSLAITCPMASAQTISVGPSGSYKTIQSALNAAGSGDTIIVSAGTYYENIAVDKSVTLKAVPAVRKMPPPQPLTFC
jgi:nitrous oxidase accessory protein